MKKLILNLCVLGVLGGQIQATPMKTAREQALADVLRNKKSDRNKDGQITVSELNNYLGQRVSKPTAGVPKPSVVAFEQDQDFDLLN